MTRIFTLAIVLLMAGQCVFAQKNKKKKGDAGDGDSKKEAKIWKNKLADMEPLEFKKLMENYDKAKKEASGVSRQVASLTKQIQDLDAQLASKEQEILDWQKKIDELKSQSTSDDATQKADADKFSTTTAGGAPAKGIVFKVQVGAYQNLDLSKFKDNGVFFVQDEGNQKKYTIGVFRDYVQAHIFRRYIEKMGVKGPFVVAYKDGVRIDDITKVVSKPFDESMLTEETTQPAKADAPSSSDDAPKKRRRKKISDSGE